MEHIVIISMLKGGGHNKFLGSINMEHLSFSHAGGGATVYNSFKRGMNSFTRLEGRGAESFELAIFPFCRRGQVKFYSYKKKGGGAQNLCSSMLKGGTTSFEVVLI